MPTVFSHSVLEPDGWSRDVRVTFGNDGTVTAIDRGVRASAADTLTDLLIPAPANAHSHAFQRALAGFAEIPSGGTEDFWSWRDTMYRVAGLIGPEDLHSVARWVYAEMLAAGYAHVVEFHYVHGPGAPGQRVDALIEAAGEAGIGLTLLPVLYQRAGFSQPQPAAGQQPFVLEPEQLLELVARVERKAAQHPWLRAGAALHSLRAVHPEGARSMLGELPNGLAVHIHAAEQPGEVADCLAATGQRPLEWILEHLPIDDSWSVVHATHAEVPEIRGLAASGATTVVCPTTEANLGDGIFRLVDFIREGAEIAIGSDSHVSVDPADELRQMEYASRLQLGRRMTTHPADLWRRVARGGWRAAGARGGRIAVGWPAHLLALEASHPLMQGRTADEQLAAYLFLLRREAVQAVWSFGRPAVLERRFHQSFSSLIQRLGAQLGRT